MPISEALSNAAAQLQAAQQLIPFTDTESTDKLADAYKAISAAQAKYQELGQ